MLGFHICLINKEEKLISNCEKKLLSEGAKVSTVELDENLCLVINEINPDILLLTEPTYKTINKIIPRAKENIFTRPYLYLHNDVPENNSEKEKFLKVPLNYSDFCNKLTRITQNHKNTVGDTWIIQDYLLQNTQDFVVVINEEGFITYASPSIKNVLGFSPADLIDKSVFNFIDPEYSERAKNRFQLLFEANQAGYAEIKLRNNKNESLFFETFAENLIHNPSVKGIIINCRNITDKKRIEKKLKKEKETLFSILNHAPYAVVLINKENKFELANKEFVSITGFNLDETPDIYTWFAKVYPDTIYQDKLIHTYMKVKLDDGLFKVIKIKCKNGVIKDVEYRVNHLTNQKKLLTIKDITDIKQSEAALSNSLDLLAANKFIIENRNKQLAELNKELNQSKKQLTELNASKDKFFSILAHDLRAPFNAILGMSHLAYTDFDNFNLEELKMINYDIHNASKHIYNLLENLLTWAKVSQGVLDYRPAKLNVAEICAQVLMSLFHNAKNKGIQLISNIDKKILVVGDEKMVYSVFQNLISNAIKFSNHGGKVEINYNIPDNDYVEIEIKDSGIGIDQEKIENLFKIDSNISTNGTENEKGSGLGLILCKEFVEKNGGRISVDSKQGEGTIFRFSLPLFFN